MDTKFMKLALKEAEKARQKDEVPIGCVIVQNGKVIAKSHNTKNTKANALYHAEIIALMKAQKKTKDWHFNDMELYSTLEPCPMCAGAIINFRVGKVYFGASDKKAGSVGSVVNLFEEKSFNHHPEYQGGIMEKECSEILTNFFKEKRNQQ